MFEINLFGKPHSVSKGVFLLGAATLVIAWFCSGVGLFRASNDLTGSYLLAVFLVLATVQVKINGVSRSVIPGKILDSQTFKFLERVIISLAFGYFIYTSF